MFCVGSHPVHAGYTLFLRKHRVTDPLHSRSESFVARSPVDIDRHIQGRITGEFLHFFGLDVPVFQQQVDISDPSRVKVQPALGIILGDTGGREVSVEGPPWVGKGHRAGYRRARRAQPARDGMPPCRGVEALLILRTPPVGEPGQRATAGIPVFGLGPRGVQQHTGALNVEVGRGQMGELVGSQP